MGWASLSISSEISKIESTAKGIERNDPKTSEALHAIASALKKIEEAMDKVAYDVRGR